MLSLLHPGTEPRRRHGIAACLALCLIAGGCAASGALRRGSDAEHRQDYDLAVVEYAKALRLRPDDAQTRAALERSKMRASLDHFTRGRRLAATGKFDQALVEYQVAAELNPSNGDLDRELIATRAKLRARIAVAREGKTELQTLIDRARDLPPPGMDLPTGVKMPASLTFRDAASRDVFTAISRLANISLIFDSAFRDTPVTVDLRNTTLEDALSTVAGATRTFFRVTAPKTIVVIPDTPAKRREYEEEIVKTFYLSNADLKETMDLLRMVLDARRISPTTATNALTIKDSPERIAAASRVISAIDKARPEVIIDVELIEVDRTKLAEYGLQLASPGSTGLNGTVSINGATSTSGISLSALRNLSQSDLLLASLPSLYYRLLKSDTNTRTLANPQLRTTDGVAATARFGDQVPVPVTTFAPLAQGGAAQQPITSFNYQNIGVNIDITPRTHHDDDVSLQLKIAVTNISGTGYQGLPTFGNREITTIIRLRDGETNMLAGLIRDEERHSLDGMPGLSDLPMVGRLFGHTTRSTTQTDIILTLTPHIIRVLDLTEADLRPFRVGRDSLAPIAELPLLPVEPPKPPEPPKPADTVNPLLPVKKPGGK
ncbi:MAG TPA: secretin N-terminal domain-containing protein [Vicinamibacterales bacterium]|jgi:general secretion pathway protein D|nr:secretin N-terminal domain-containing protein [Vicinamibacterales bacterium]